MTQRSPDGLRVLHAVRLLGFADTAAIADRGATPRAQALAVLHDAEAHGWVQRLAFADLSGWALTDEGRSENERQLARERALADPEHRIEAAYREFLPLNARLVNACTDWQIRPTSDDVLAPNDHTDTAWDSHVLSELAGLNDALSPLNRQLSGVLARFDGYDARFEAALRRAQDGQHGWVDKTNIDSCHRVWFQLHEDLIATLGIDRSTENADRPL